MADQQLDRSIATEASVLMKSHFLPESFIIASGGSPSNPSSAGGYWLTNVCAPSMQRYGSNGSSARLEASGGSMGG